MTKKIRLNVIGGGRADVEYGARLFDVAAMFPGLSGYPILAAKVNNDLMELGERLIVDSEIDFINIASPNGMRIYQRTAAFMMICAARSVIGRRARIVVEHSINKDYYCELASDNVRLTKTLLSRIEDRMTELAEKDLVIEKVAMTLADGIKLCEEDEAWDKVEALKYRRTGNVNFYKLDGYYDYFYGDMAYNTGAVRLFKLAKAYGGFLLRVPSASNPDEIPEAKSLVKVAGVFKESNKWAKILKAENVGSLNNIICEGGISDFIRVNEALHEKKIASIADMIHSRGVRVALVSGPSSSGKTTFSHRLAIQLRVNGLKPHVISLDNYFLDRDKTPKDKSGEPNFEDVDAIDADAARDHLARLLRGDPAEIPVFSFQRGERESRGRVLKLGGDGALIVEGIHALNESLTGEIPKEHKFKIFISALTQLNIDEHNRIATSDARLIRRIVRDNLFRGFGAAKTLEVWPSVGRGEKKNIFPYQEEADAVFNSALVYELCVLKQFAEPLLFGIGKDVREYTEARRLIKFLDSFLGVSSESVPLNSILREFIGGSCFKD